jgi:hypothetical protein
MELLSLPLLLHTSREDTVQAVLHDHTLHLRVPPQTSEQQHQETLLIHRRCHNRLHNKITDGSTRSGKNNSQARPIVVITKYRAKGCQPARFEYNRREYGSIKLRDVPRRNSHTIEGRDSQKEGISQKRFESSQK